MNVIWRSLTERASNEFGLDIGSDRLVLSAGVSSGLLEG